MSRWQAADRGSIAGGAQEVGLTLPWVGKPDVGLAELGQQFALADEELGQDAAGGTQEFGDIAMRRARN